MRKILLICLLSLCLLLTGCSKEKDIYEHYDLIDKDLNIYNYYDEKYGMQTYALADITPENYESVLTGFFYEVKNNDYVLLETLELSTNNAYNNDNMYQFYNNKLYGVGNGNTPMMFEIELKGKNSAIKEINFKMNDRAVGPTSIKNIENDIITVFAYSSSESQAIVTNYFDCSLKTYQCDIVGKN